MVGIAATIIAASLLALRVVAAASSTPQPGTPDTVAVQILAINDFHGALEPRELRGRPVGGAATLAAYLAQWMAEAREEGVQSLVVGSGDLIGGSPPISSLLRDEPAVDALGLMGLRVSAVGNHEFDRGVAELMRLQHGGCHTATGCFPGAPFGYLAANVVDEASGDLLFPPYAVERIDGVAVAFVGVVLKETPSIVRAPAVAGLRFLEEVEAVNREVADLQAQGIRVIVVLIHQGGRGDLDGLMTGEIVPIVQAMDDEVDVVVSGHSHQGYRGFIGSKLVTQAFAHGTAFADIDLFLDRRTGDVVEKRARIVDTFADVPPGDQPDLAVAALVQAAARNVAPLVERVVALAGSPITNSQTSAGESALGNLIADAQRWSLDGEIAFMNPGGIRAELHAGPVTWGEFFTVQPFGNRLVGLTLTGAQIERLLEQQWEDQPFPRILHVSGLTYVWDPNAPVGNRVDPSDVRVGVQPLEPDAHYRVVVTDFLADGANNFSVFLEGTDRVVGPSDLDALVDYVAQRSQPFTSAVEGRIQIREGERE
jgi:5'-nucleotidase